MTEKNEVLQYLKKLLCFVSPFILFFSFPLFVLLASGELTSPDRIIQLQQNNTQQTLVGLAYSNPEIYYKFHSVLKRTPQIIALGNSRVLEIKDNFFSHGSFFNAGRAAQKIRHFRTFLDNIPKGKEPQIMIIGLDQKLFTESYDNLEDDDFNNKLYHYDSPLDIFLNNWLNTYKNYLWKRKFSLTALYNENKTVAKIGLGALKSNKGFRNDGSYDYNFSIKNYVADQESLDIDLAKIKNYDAGDFPAADHINEKAIYEFDTFLAEANSRNIQIITFLPPFAPTIYEALRKDSIHFPYIFQLGQKIQPIFKKYHFNFFDFSNPTSIKSTDMEFINGSHGSDTTYLRLLISIAEKDKNIQKFTDLNQLKDTLSQSIDPSPISQK